MSDPRSPFIPVWLDSARLTPIEFRVLANLWSRWNPRRRQCNPSAERIAADCLLNRKTVFAVLDRLEGRGLIQRLKKPFGGSNCYLPIVPPDGTIDAAPIVPPGGTPIVPPDGTPIVPSSGTGTITIERSQGNDHKHTPAPAGAGVCEDEHLLRAFVELDGGSVSELTKSDRKRTEQALAEIIDATPGVTTDELRARWLKLRGLKPPGCHLDRFVLTRDWARCAGRGNYEGADDGGW